MLKNALAYRRLNWSVLPLRPDKKIPHIKWKKYQTQLPTEEEIKQWFKKWPKAQIGVITGKISNLVVIDFDSANAIERFRALYDLPETIMQTTARGSQYFFAYTSDIKNQAGILKKVDVRGEGGLVVLPPSKHKSGKHYKWGHINPTEDGLDDLLDLTPELIKLCQGQKPAAPKATKTNKPRSKNKPGWVDEALLGVNQGQRNQTCTKLAGYYLRVLQGDTEETFAILKHWNGNFNKPPLDDKEIRKIVESISTRQGLNELTEVMGTEIYQMEILNYPDRNKAYRIYIDGLDKYITLTPDDIAGQRRFRVKLMTITKKLAAPIKEKDWCVLITQVLSEATDIQMEEDETNLAAIRRIIMNDIKCGEREEPENFIDGSVVIYKNNIHLLINVIERNLYFEGTNIRDKKEIGSLLRSMGFASKSVHLHSQMRRTWQINKDKFIKHSEQINENGGL